jgi:hypothetical protein
VKQVPKMNYSVTFGDNGIPVKSAMINFSGNVTGFAASMGRPGSALDNAYSGFMMNYSNISMIKAIQFTFTVNSSYLSGNNMTADKIRLLGMMSNWTEFNATIKSINETEVIYVAVAPGLTEYAIALHKEEPIMIENITKENPVLKINELDDKVVPVEKKDVIPVNLVIGAIFGLMVVSGGVAWFFLRK